jgi:hypothetical protein
MRRPPARHWPSYGNDKLPTGAEALDEPFTAFPSWFLRITCDRCGEVQIINEAHAKWRGYRTLRLILARMRHDGCGGLAGQAELVTAADSASSRPVRKPAAVRQYRQFALAYLPSPVTATSLDAHRHRSPLEGVRSPPAGRAKYVGSPPTQTPLVSEMQGQQNSRPGFRIYRASCRFPDTR